MSNCRKENRQEPVGRSSKPWTFLSSSQRLPEDFRKEIIFFFIMLSVKMVFDKSSVYAERQNLYAILLTQVLSYYNEQFKWYLLHLFSIFQVVDSSSQSY
jgi:hypothetical protein